MGVSLRFLQTSLSISKKYWPFLAHNYSVFNFKRNPKCLKIKSLNRNQNLCENIKIDKLLAQFNDLNCFQSWDTKLSIWYSSFSRGLFFNFPGIFGTEYYAFSGLFSSFIQFLLLFWHTRSRTEIENNV